MALNRRQIFGLILSVLVVLLSFSPQARSLFSLHEDQRLSVGENLELVLKLPPSLLRAVNVSIREGEKLFSLDGSTSIGSYSLGETPLAVKPGTVKLQLKLFGLIPLKQINVNVFPDIKLVPGGHSIGVLLRTDGVMVVGYSPVPDEQNEPSFPAREADIAIGDVIIEVNGTKVITDDQVKHLVTAAQKTPIKMKVKRNGKLQEKTIYPKFCQDTKTYRIGLYVRDNAGGVGTLTFFEPSSKKYGALGHVIADAETNQKIKILQGKILLASIEDIQKAKRGSPGEKVGIFVEDSDLGNIEKNEDCGIFGVINHEITNSIYPEPLPIEYANKIYPGEAQILTVLKDQEIKKYDIIIEKVMGNLGRIDGRNMIIRMKDPELLTQTGGIVQGMSGSPIIQNGKIIGAVTHVFVNDPNRGYGVFIENMLIEAGILQIGEKTLGYNTQGFFHSINMVKSTCI